MSYNLEHLEARVCELERRQDKTKEVLKTLADEWCPAILSLQERFSILLKLLDDLETEIEIEPFKLN